MQYGLAIVDKSAFWNWVGVWVGVLGGGWGFD